jgi:decaprenylphospho-beta-D-ribofuranose 2-oxidase
MRWKTSKISGWGRALWAETTLSRADRVSGLISAFMERPAPAVGNLRSYGDAALNSDKDMHLMSRLDQIISLDTDAGILSAEAGITLGSLLNILTPRGLMPPVLPGTGFATLGGAIAMDVHGKNHHGAGSIGSWIDALEILLPDGTQKRATPNRNKDLFWASIGGLGQTGIIVSATLRLKRCTSDQVTISEHRMDNLQDFLAGLDGSISTYSVGWIDITRHGDTLGRGILEESDIASSVIQSKNGKPKSVPFNAPSFLMSRGVVKLFNEAYFRRIPEGGRSRLRSMQDFFFPLDRINNWNKLYGKTGFHQFQCVVPTDNAHEVLTEILNVVVQSKLASPLAVLKKMGASSGGYMSFPMEGYTLALDVPDRPKTKALFAKLEKITNDAGGRIYLAKDSLGSSQAIKAMYPDLSKWQKVVSDVDPDATLETDLVRRLKLRGQS